MFPNKLHQTQNFHNHHPHHYQPPPAPPHTAFHHHPFQYSGAGAAVECQTSEEADSCRSPTTKRIALTPQPQPVSSSGGGAVATNDGATIEVVRRPRGRPPGSRNKPKPPVIITREAEPVMSPYIIEIPCGVDIIESISQFCKKRNMGLCVLNGSGSVSNVTLRQPTLTIPTPTPGSTVTFHGRFDLLSISATIVEQSNSNSSGFGSHGFTISLAGPQGQVVGGAVVGPLLSASSVFLIAATFNNPSYHRLPAAEDDGGGGGERQSPPHAEVSGGRADSGHPIYSLPPPSADVMWAPTASRQPPPPY